MAPEEEWPETNGNYPESPELDKMSEFTDSSQIIGEFVDWMTGERGIVLAEYREDVEQDWPIPICININELLAEYYGVDLKKVEEERRDILGYLQGKWKEENPPKVKIMVTAEDTVEVTEVKGEISEG